uniref:TIR domain-containing protein n=1 Tax=Glycine max TaxID=3847 RepID=A0A0R0JM17_SOYBN
MAETFSGASRYDVFINFRGEDTRHGFTGHLYKALCDKGIRAFMEEVDLKRGEEITRTLEEAIKGSRIAITVLSKDYASSSFCLNELETILGCYREKTLLVIPVFYKVDPSDVRRLQGSYAEGLAMLEVRFPPNMEIWKKALQERKRLLVLPIFYKVDPSNIRYHRGSFGEALANHEMKFKAKMDGLEHNMEKLEKWKMALHETANFSGYHFKQGDGYEYEFITRIVDLVSSKIKQDPFHVGDYPVGLESYSEAFNYDVFLSFRGSDTLHGFTGYLYKALRDSGFHTFIDEDLNRGEEITPAIVKAIEESKIAIIVLSINYASSSFCLDELATIRDCLERKRMLVLPVFYNVDHSQVRMQEGSYGEALVKHEESLKHSMEKLEKWKMALHQVANLSDIKIKHGSS